jgi:hypothetical protein
MAIDVSPNTQANRDESPTNPKFADSSISNGDLMAVIIQTHPSGNPTFTIGSEVSNQANTKGFRIKHDTDGSNLLTLSSFGTIDYFVLIHSDDPAKHHFAKITNLVVEDNGNGTTTGDAFEFEPRIGNEIPKGTKYRVITGVNNDSIVALSIGLKQESTYNLKNNIVCARPHFYFYNNKEISFGHGKLDKKNELNHNKKYMAHINSRTGSGTIEMGPHVPVFSETGTTGIVFRTQQDFGKRIIDYSKFGLTVTMTDVLRNIDEDGFGTTASGTTLLNFTFNGANSITTDYTDYLLAYPNARRDGGNSIDLTWIQTGPTKYLHYDTSPKSANLITGVSQHETEDSIEQGSFSETRIIDNARIMRKKIEEHTLYQTKQLVHIGNLNDFVDLKATYSSTSSTNVFVFDTEYNLQTVLEVGEEIRLGTTIMLVETVSGSSITVRAEKREAGKNTFTSVAFTPTVGDTLQRRALDYTNQRIFTTMDLSGGVDKLEILFTSGNLRNLFGEVTAKNIDQSTLTFNGLLDNSDFKSYYGAEAVKFAKGEYRVFSTRFTGEVEEINQVKEEGQTFLDIKGRDSMNKLLSPVVNKNTVFSEDIIYSTSSPYNKIGNIKNGNTYTLALGATTLDTNILDGANNTLNGSNFDNYPTVGSHLFTENGYIGRVTAVDVHNTDKARFTINGALTRVNNEAIYVETEKNYVFTKALGSSHIAQSSATSLVGSSGKGAIITAGNSNGGLSSNGSEGNTLVGTSSFNSDKAIGYQIHQPSGIANDNSFQTRLKDEIGNNGESTFDTVNTLIDFEVVNTSKKDNKALIELAPYIPITLGRRITYEGSNDERIETEYTQAAVCTTNQTAGIAVFVTSSLSSSVNIGDPLYADQFDGTTETKGFIGYVLDVETLQATQSLYSSGNPSANQTTISVLLDRTETPSGSTVDYDVGDVIFFSTRKRHHINVVNSAHLWGGKIQTIPHLNFSSEIKDGNTAVGIVPFNLNISTEDYNKRYGMPYYKSFNIDDKRLGSELVTLTSSPFLTSCSLYDVRGNNFHKNLTSYKFKPNKASVLTTNLIEEGKTDSLRSMPYDIRGHTSAKGSNITQSQRMRRGLETLSVPRETTVANYGRIKTRSAFANKYFDTVDMSFPRLFFYIVSDLLPYSGQRPDSIFHTSGGVKTKNINNYKLFMIENKDKTSSNNLILEDSNFQSISFTTETDITSLKRFGLMRLTECVFDEHFNLINPEKPVNEIDIETVVGADIISRKQALLHTDGTGINTVDIFVDNSGTPKIQFNQSITLTAEDEIYTDTGQFIGKIANTGTGVQHACSNLVFTPDFSVAHSNVYRLTKTLVAGFGGREGQDSIDTDGNGTYHPLKGAIVPKETSTSSRYDYGEFGSSSTNSQHYAFDRNGGNPIVLMDNAEVVLPKIYGSTYTNPTAYSISWNVANHKVVGKAVTTDAFGNPNYANAGNPFGGTIGVILDRYSIEDGDGKLETGDCTGVLGTHTDNIKFFGTKIGAREITTVGALNHYKHFLQTNSTSLHDYGVANVSSPADGAFIGFKLRLYYTSNANGMGSFSSVKTSNGNAQQVTIIPKQAGYSSWLEFVDLTGCYLRVEHIAGSQANQVGGLVAGGEPRQPIYVYSHDINAAGQATLTLSEALQDGRAYRILQPNPICMYDFSPADIEFNVLKPEYTKKPNNDEMYGNRKNNYFFGEGGQRHLTTGESVLSMYVMLDLDKQSTSSSILASQTLEVLPIGDYSLFFSDGKNSIKTNCISKRNSSTKHGFSIEERKTLKGVVSVSETFVVDSLEELKINPTRACIGSTVTIADETESLINEIFEEEGIEFTNSTITYPLFIAPEFRGVSAFTAINFLLKRKDLRLLETDGVFSVVPHSDSSLVTNILIDDDKLIEFQSTKTTFDFYNEIIVYGASHKGIKRNLNSIKKIGRKTLEEVDSSLVTQQDVDEQASRLLDLHGNLNIKHKIKVIPTGIEQVKAGDIIQFESKQENIGLSNFLVLNVNHELFGFVTLEIGRYSKRLEDVFSELLLKTQNNANKNRSQDYISKTPSLDFLEKIKVKPISLTIRKRVTTGATLGFTTTLNTNTVPLGIGGSSTTTLLKEEDLI